MRDLLSKHKGLVTFVVALLAAAYSHWIEPIPVADDKTWDALLGVVAAGSAIHAGKSLGLIDILGLLKKLAGAKKSVEDVIDKDADGDPDPKEHA